MSGDNGIVIHIDPVEAEESKARRDRFINVVLFPRYRAAGFLLLLLAVVLHNRFILHQVSGDDVLRLAAGYAVYCLLSWRMLAAWYERHRLLGLLFFALDVVAWTFAIYASGGSQSWLFFVLVLRSADQVPIGTRRVLGFGLLGLVSYAAMLAWVALVDQTPVVWAPEFIKMTFMAASTGYLVFPALNSQRLRMRNAQAMRAARDAISALNAHALQLEEARRRAEEATRVKGEFVAKISHELRTPMNVIMGMTELVLDSELTDLQREHLGLVRECSEEFMGTIQNLLDFSALERSELQLEIQPFSLRQVLSRVCEVCLEKAKAKDVSLRCSADADVPDTLVGDPTRLQQVLLNLGDNAVKFTERGRIDIDTRLVAAGDKSVRLRFTVSDSGIGIPDDKQIVIFDSFTGSDDSLTRRHGGPGLGLTLSAGLVGLMGGQISVLSQVNEGATFSFDIPFDKVAWAQSGS